MTTPYQDPNVLLERTTAGLTVRVSHLPKMQLTVLACEAGDEVAARTIPDEAALDAFTHPTLYLNEAQLKQLQLI